MAILAIIEELEATSSSKEKLSILESHKDNEFLRDFFHLCLDPFVRFGIKKIPSYTTKTIKLDFGQALEALVPISKREVTGGAAISRLKHILESMHPQDAQLLERVIAKDPACGVQAVTVNKVWDDLIPEFPVLKAYAYDQEKFHRYIQFPAFGQIKFDGARCTILVAPDSVTVLSASGREMERLNTAFAWLSSLSADHFVLDGELLVVNHDGVFNRQTGNGVINKAIKNTISEKEIKSIKFVAFDFIPFKDWDSGVCNIPYKKRHHLLVSLFKPMDLTQSNITVVSNEELFSIEETLEYYQHLLSQGEEGVILRDKNSLWEGKRRRDIVKFKQVLTCDLLVKEVLPGTGKNEGKVGALLCADQSGTLEVSVGTGLSDEDRNEPNSYWLDKLIEVGYNQIISATGKEKRSLFLPRFIRVRDDKTIPDTL